MKPKSFESRQNSFFFFFYPGWMRLMFTCVLGRYWGCFCSTRTFRRALTASVDSCAEIKSNRRNQIFSGVTKSGRVWRKCRKAMLGMCGSVLPVQERSWAGVHARGLVFFKHQRGLIRTLQIAVFKYEWWDRVWPSWTIFCPLPLRFTFIQTAFHI